MGTVGHREASTGEGTPKYGFDDVPWSLFLKIAIGFGLPIGVLTSLGDASSLGVFLGIASAKAVVVGTIAGLVLGRKHLVDSAKAGRPEGDLGVRDELSVELPVPFGQVLPVMRMAVEDAEGLRLVSEDKDQVRVHASASMSGMNWGERVDLSAEPGAEGSRVTVTSTPKLPWTLVDFGKSRLNVNRVAESLRVAAGAPS